MLKVRWSTGVAGRDANERVIAAVDVEAIGGNGSGTYVAFKDKDGKLLLLVPGNRLLDAAEIEAE